MFENVHTLRRDVVRVLRREGTACADFLRTDLGCDEGEVKAVLDSLCREGRVRVSEASVGRPEAQHSFELTS